MKNKSLKPPMTISETIFQFIKKSIINGEFMPKQRLQEKEIAEIFSVSTTPVREAFQRLSAEKYVILNARKEVIVAEMSSKQIKELYEIIRVLDVFSSKKALENITDNDISELKKKTDKLSELYKKKNIQAYIKQSTRIHEILWKNCGNELLYRSLIDLQEKAIAFGDVVTSDFLSIPHYFERSYRDHIELMAAVENRDAAEVEKILSSHWGKEYYN
jgi:DNA-binding GntR family transcriptional regulator